MIPMLICTLVMAGSIVGRLWLTRNGGTLTYFIMMLLVADGFLSAVLIRVFTEYHPQFTKSLTEALLISALVLRSSVVAAWTAFLYLPPLNRKWWR